MCMFGFIHEYWTSNSDQSIMVNGSPSKVVGTKHLKLEDAESEKQKKIQNKDPLAVQTEEEDSKEESFDWEQYLAKNNAVPVPKSTFHHLIAGSTFDFESGMKLEVPNQDSSNTYWLATVIAKSGPLILLRYEGYQDDNSADFWCNSQSSEIHPVGWCAKTKHALRPPKAIQHKEKSWYDYLIKNLTGARKAAEHLFNKRQRPIDKLGVGMMLEVIDKEDPKFYWVATISEIYAGRLRLQYKGTEDSAGEIWCYYLNERLFSPGHGFVFGLTLRPPRDVLKTISEKQWPNPKLEKKLMTCWEKDLLSELLKDRPSPEEHTFRIGMKLEAKDPVDPTAICCATVARVFDKYYFLVRIDNLLSSSVHEDRSFICHKKSNGIYPVGWCHKFNLSLHPPKGFNGHFTWKGYLQLEKAIAAPETCFENEPVQHEFKVGMKLEAVDQENPVNICVATVTQVLGRNVWVMLDGESRSEQLFDVLSHDLFPVGWCEMSGHELQWPRPSTLMQKNRISRLRSTTERKTRLDHLRKGGPRAKKSIQGGQNSSNHNSDDEKDLDVKKRKRKLVKAKYYKGSKKRIKQKDEISSNKDDDVGYVDPTISYVFIRGLADSLNTEDRIRKGFNLNEDGVVPRKIITIDSDDEDDDPDSKKRIINEDEMGFFTTLKVKPKELNQQQEEQFDLLAGIKIPMSERKVTSLNSLFRRSLSSNSKSFERLRLIDYYRRQKGKHRGRFKYGIRRFAATNNDGNTITQKGTTTRELNKENLKDTDLKQLPRILRRGDRRGNNRAQNLSGKSSGESSPNLESTEDNANGSARGFDVPNGMYRVVENSIGKSQNNKIVMKIAKPQNSKDSKVNGATERSLLVDGYSPARDIPAIDSHVTNKCNQIRASCKTLPQNPLTWTKQNVIDFVQAADFSKYARIFSDEDIDGHAFLLLTLNELHNLMRIPVGPAAKLTDYIHTLQRDCARFSSKPTGATPSTTSGAEVRSENSRVTTKQQPTAKTAKSSTAKTSRTSSPEISSAPQIVDVYRISKPLFSRLKQS